MAIPTVLILHIGLWCHLLLRTDRIWQTDPEVLCHFNLLLDIPNQSVQACPGGRGWSDTEFLLTRFIWAIIILVVLVRLHVGLLLCWFWLFVFDCYISVIASCRSLISWNPRLSTASKYLEEKQWIGSIFSEAEYPHNITFFVIQYAYIGTSLC